MRKALPPARNGFRSSLRDRTLQLLGATLAWIATTRLCASLNRASASKNQRRLIKDIEREWSGVLVDHFGNVSGVPEAEQPGAFDYTLAIVDFESPNLRARVLRGRGEIVVSLGLPSSPNAWHDLLDIIAWARPEDRRLWATPATLYEFGRAIHDRLELIDRYLAMQSRQE